MAAPLDGPIPEQIRRYFLPQLPEYPARIDVDGVEWIVFVREGDGNVITVGRHGPDGWQEDKFQVKTELVPL